MLHFQLNKNKVMVAEWDEKGPITGVGGKKFRDVRDCICGGKYSMRGWDGTQYYYDCNKCKKRVTLEYISKKVGVPSPIIPKKTKRIIESVKKSQQRLKTTPTTGEMKKRGNFITRLIGKLWKR